jgi:hypothetical protein
MSIRAKELRPYVDTMTISKEAKRQLVEALAAEDHFIIHPAGEGANELSKSFRVVRLAQQDFDVIVPPSAAAPLKEFIESEEAPGVSFSSILIVHGDEPEQSDAALGVREAGALPETEAEGNE